MNTVLCQCGSEGAQHLWCSLNGCVMLCPIRPSTSCNTLYTFCLECSSNGNQKIINMPKIHFKQFDQFMVLFLFFSLCDVILLHCALNINEKYVKCLKICVPQSNIVEYIQVCLISICSQFRYLACVNIVLLFMSLYNCDLITMQKERVEWM